MAEIKTDDVIKELPGAIEEILTIHINKLNQLTDQYDQAMADLDHPADLVRNGEGLKRSIASLQDFVKRMCGEEGDTVEDNGSLWAVVTSAKKLNAAMGGDM